MRKAIVGDRVLIDGKDWTVTDAAEFDNLIRVENAYGSQVVMQSQVDWNYTVIKDGDAFDPDLLVDYN